MKFYTINEAADLMRVSRTTIYRLLRSGKLQSVRVGSYQRITEEQIQAYTQQHTIQQDGQ